ncbi:MAG: hypothetical protein ABH858_02565 [Candidatus Omnitrophota bacterium]
MKRRKKAQAVTTEYAIMVTCIIASLLVMQAYFRRGHAGQIKQMVDNNLGDQFDPQHGVYNSTFSQEGDTVEVSRVERKDFPNGEFGWYTINYGVTGPQAYNVDGKEVIAGDAGRKKLTTLSYQTADVNWQEIGLE